MISLERYSHYKCLNDQIIENASMPYHHYFTKTLDINDEDYILIKNAYSTKEMSTEKLSTRFLKYIGRYHIPISIVSVLQATVVAQPHIKETLQKAFSDVDDKHLKTVSLNKGYKILKKHCTFFNKNDRYYLLSECSVKEKQTLINYDSILQIFPPFAVPDKLFNWFKVVRKELKQGNNAIQYMENEMITYKDFISKLADVCPNCVNELPVDEFTTMITQKDYVQVVFLNAMLVSRKLDFKFESEEKMKKRIWKLKYAIKKNDSATLKDVIEKKEESTTINYRGRSVTYKTISKAIFISLCASYNIKMTEDILQYRFKGAIWRENYVFSWQILSLDKQNCKIPLGKAINYVMKHYYGFTLLKKIHVYVENNEIIWEKIKHLPEFADLGEYKNYEAVKVNEIFKESKERRTLPQVSEPKAKSILLAKENSDMQPLNHSKDKTKQYQGDEYSFDSSHEDHNE